MSPPLTERRLLPRIAIVLAAAALVACGDDDAATTTQDDGGDGAAATTTGGADGHDGGADVPLPPDSGDTDGGDDTRGGLEDADAVDSDPAGDTTDTTDTTDAPDAPDAADAPDSDAPRDPAAVFGTKYWDVYRPHFLAHHYESGRVSDRNTAGQKMFGDNTLWMSYALTLFVYEYRAAHLPESLERIDEILTAYETLDALPANPPIGYLVQDPLDGYVYRSDRGPDYAWNWCITTAGAPCLPQTGTRDNEPSGDQMLATLRGLSDVVRSPDALVWQGRDAKARAAAHARRLGTYLVRTRYQMTNILGEPVKRGPDQRWASWAFERGAALVSGDPVASFETTWFVLGLPVAPGAAHESVGRWFLRYAVKFTSSCVSGQEVDLDPLLGIPLVVSIACNEFNIGLGGDGAVIACDRDPSSERWFSKVIDRADVVAEGNALYALYARHLFGDADPQLAATTRRFLTAPATPPTGANLDPNGWCTSWRWAKDFDDPERCTREVDPLTTFSGLDYLVPCAIAAAFGETCE